MSQMPQPEISDTPDCKDDELFAVKCGQLVKLEQVSESIKTNVTVLDDPLKEGSTESLDVNEQLASCTNGVEEVNLEKEIVKDQEEALNKLLNQEDCEDGMLAHSVEETASSEDRIEEIDLKKDIVKEQENALNKAVSQEVEKVRAHSVEEKDANISLD